MNRAATFNCYLSPPGTPWRSDAVQSFGEPWPTDILRMFESYGARFEEHASWAIFELPDQIHAARTALNELRSGGVAPVISIGTVKNPPRNSIHSARWYHCAYPEERAGFIATDLVESERPCDLPMPDFLGGGGCSVRKKQIRKFKVGSLSAAVSSLDCLSAQVPFFSLPWHRLIVSARARDVLCEGGLTGFTFYPVSGPGATDEQRLLDRGSCESDSADWFQWVITGRTSAERVDDFTSIPRVDGEIDCNICGRRSGDAQRNRQSGTEELVGTADVQLCEEYVLPDGRQIPNLFGPLFVSSKFVERCVLAKLRGLSGWEGSAPTFLAAFSGSELNR